MDQLERTVVRKVAWRILPLLLVCYIGAYLDRFNVSYAALTMNKSLGFTAEIFGLGAGLFFVGYSAFEIPSNILLHRFGARVWIARIMVTWGALAAGMAFVHGATSFAAMRFLLGVGEAGFFPGVLFYLMLWFPARYRGRMIAAFMVAIPVSGVIGAPISGLILTTMDGVAGFESWQWLFIMEGVPVVALGLVVLAVLTDRPADARWLSDTERGWLVETMRAEASAAAPVSSKLRAVLNPRVIALGAVYFCSTSTVISLGFFLPLIVRAGFGLRPLATTLIVMLPYVTGLAGILLFGFNSDRTLERRWHVVAALGVGAVGVGAAGLLGDPGWQLAALCVATFGMFGIYAPFWAFSTNASGLAAAVAIAAINTIGQTSGFVGPYLVGFLKDHTGTFGASLLMLAALRLVAIAIVLRIDRVAAPIGSVAQAAIAAAE